MDTILTRMRRRAAIAVAAIAVVSGCGIDQDPYPLPEPPPGNSIFHAVALDETVTEPVVFIEARRELRAEIISAEPIGQFEGATVVLYASPLVDDGEGGFTVGDERIELAGLRINEVVDPSADPPANELAIVAEITGSEPGRYVLSGVRLSYRINGAPERDGEGIDTVLTVCADDPAPTICDDSSG